MIHKYAIALVGLTMITSFGLTPLSAFDHYALYTATDASTVFATDTTAANIAARPCTYTSATCTADTCGQGCGEGCGEGCGQACGGLSCCGACCLGEPLRIDSKDDGIDIGGWWQGGYSSGNTGMFNNVPDRFNTHQLWLYAEKVADGSCGPDFGFRVDFMYGIDAADTQAFGNDVGTWDFINGWDFGATYGMALPQAYVEYANGDLLQCLRLDRKY